MASNLNLYNIEFSSFTIVPKWKKSWAIRSGTCDVFTLVMLFVSFSRNCIWQYLWGIIWGWLNQWTEKYVTTWFTIFFVEDDDQEKVQCRGQYFVWSLSMAKVRPKRRIRGVIVDIVSILSTFTFSTKLHCDVWSFTTPFLNFPGCHHWIFYIYCHHPLTQKH